MPFVEDPDKEYRYWRVDLRKISCDDQQCPDCLSREHSVHFFSTNASDTIVEWKTQHQGRPDFWRWLCNPRGIEAVNEERPFAVASSLSQVVVNLAFLQEYSTGSSMILQATAVCEVPDLDGKRNTIQLEARLCETHPPDGPSQQEDIPSPYTVTLEFSLLDPARHASLLRKFKLKKEDVRQLRMNQELRGRLTYEQLVEDIFQRTRHPEGDVGLYAHSRDRMEKACVAVDWVGPLALPIWKTNQMTHLKGIIPRRYPTGFLKLLLRHARALVGDTSTAGNKKRRLFDTLQAAVQLYVHAFPYFPDRKYKNGDPAFSGGATVTTEVVLDMHVEQNLDCEDGGIGAAELAHELIRVIDPAKEVFTSRSNPSEYLKPQVCWIFQDFGGMHPPGVSLSQTGQFHGTCFLFYEEDTGEQRWVGLDGVNPRLSTPSRRIGDLCNDIWALLTEDHFLETFSDCDIRVALWDQAGSAWMEGVSLMQSHSEGIIRFYQMQTREGKTVSGLPFKKLLKGGFKGQGNVVRETQLPACDEGLWRFKPRVIFIERDLDDDSPTLDHVGTVTSGSHRVLTSSREAFLQSKTVVSRLVFNATSKHQAHAKEKALEILNYLRLHLLEPPAVLSQRLSGISCFCFSVHGLVSFVFVVYGREVN